METIFLYSITQDIFHINSPSRNLFDSTFLFLLSFRCKVWIEKSERADLAEKISVHEDRVCEKHFDPSSFLNDYRNRLHQTAIPTLFLDPQPIQPNRPVPKLKPMHSLMPSVS